MPETILHLGADNAGEDVSASEFANAEFEATYRYDQERDYIDKREEYYCIGVREYVIVDRFKRPALVLTWQEDEWHERALSETKFYASPLLPGLQVALAEALGS